MNKMTNVFTINDIMKTVSGEPQQALYSLSVDPKKDAKRVDRKYIEMILNKDKDDFDPTFIFKDLGLGNTLKNKRIHRHYDIVTLNKGDYPGIKGPTQTTIGRLLINKIVFSNSRLDYINVNLTGKMISKIFSSIRDFIIAGKLTMDDFKKTMKVFEDFGFRMGTFISPSMDAEMLRSNSKLEAKKKELFAKYDEQLKANNVEASTKVEAELVDYAKELYQDQDYLEWYKSGSSSKMGYGNDFKVSQLMIGAIPKGLGSGEFHVSTSNFMKGIQKDEMHVLADQMIVALHAKGVDTAVSGYLAKQGTAIFQTVKLDVYGSDCKTKDGVMVHITDSTKEDYLGNYLTDGTLLTKENLNKYVNKTVKMRNVYTCKNPVYCSKCAGELIYKLDGGNEQIPIGLEIGSIYTELTQMALQKTHKMTAQLQPIGDINKYLV